MTDLPGFYLVTIGFTFGVGLGSLLNFNLHLIFLMSLIGLGLFLIARGGEGARRSIGILGLSLVSVSFGLFYIEIHHSHLINTVYETQLGQRVELFGTIVREPDVRPSSTHLYVEVGEELFLVLAPAYGTYSYLDQVSVSGTLKKPEVFATDLGREFNYPGYLWARGVTYQVVEASVSVTREYQGHHPVAYLLDYKQEFLDRINLLIPEPGSGLASGLLLGVKRALGEELESDFRRTGIIHIVVLSGYNIMLVILFFKILFLRFLSPRWQIIWGLIIISSFALMVGLSATVLRASLMAMIILLLDNNGRQKVPLRVLLLALVVLLVFNPFLLVYDPGFQLSFLATLGLILLNPILEARLGWWTWFTTLKDVFVATVTTQIMVWPILLYQIGEFSAVAVVVNLLVIPLVPLAMFLTFLCVAVSLVHYGLGMLLAYLANIVLAYIVGVAGLFASWSLASFVIPPFSFFLVVLSYGLIILFLYVRAKRAKYHSLDTDRVVSSGDVADWTIVEEEDLFSDNGGVGNVLAKRKNTSTELPVFFR